MSNTNDHGNIAPPSPILYQDKFSNHVVVVTGAAAGIGRETAQMFSAQGAHVILIDINQASLEEVELAIRQSGAKADARRCDISNEEDIDILVNLAGVYEFKNLVDFPIDLYHRVIDINLHGSFYLTRAVLPHMQKAQYGRIIHTSSSTYADPKPGLAPYIASKAAVIGLVRATAVEAGPGVTVNAIMPGLIDTEHVRSLDRYQDLLRIVIGNQAVKRKGVPSDIAHAVCFIASPEASFFSGQLTLNDPVVFANAGILENQSFYMHHQGDEDSIPPPPSLKTIDVNLCGAIYTAYLALHFLRKTEGAKSLIITCSTGGLYPVAGAPLYAAAKHGVLGLTRSLAGRMWSEDRIRVNCICPGTTVTGIMGSGGWDVFPADVITNVDQVAKAVKSILDDSTLHGQAVEIVKITIVQYQLGD
ncbi:Reductase [Aspergillus nanangensis]|uniref:Reductase n=1 Tax=Aspergillus nanangensis TaxID=2582783 RepID=A0AAD4CQG1_ASPNN|nr:Reductase [Aspergillus nanangensis]